MINSNYKNYQTYGNVNFGKAIQLSRIELTNSNNELKIIKDNILIKNSEIAKDLASQLAKIIFEKNKTSKYKATIFKHFTANPNFSIFKNTPDVPIAAFKDPGTDRIYILTEDTVNNVYGKAQKPVKQKPSSGKTGLNMFVKQMGSIKEKFKNDLVSDMKLILHVKEESQKGYILTDVTFEPVTTNAGKLNTKA